MYNGSIKNFHFRLITFLYFIVFIILLYSSYFKMAQYLKDSTWLIIEQLKIGDFSILSQLYGPLSHKIQNLRLEEPHVNLTQLILKANMTSAPATRQVAVLLDQIDRNSKEQMHCSVQFRRISRSRIQACCDVGGLTFIWESLSISHDHDWKMRRITFTDADDEEYYWRPWQASQGEAEIEYSQYRRDFENLDRPDILDTDLAWIRSASTSSASSSINSDEMADVFASLHHHYKEPVFMKWSAPPPLDAYELRDNETVDYWDRYGIEYGDC